MKVNTMNIGIQNKMSWMTFLLVAGFCALITGCSSKPSEGDGNQAVKNQINQDSQGRIKLVGFHKTNGQMADINAVKVYNLEFDAEIEFTSDCKWITGGDMDLGFRTLPSADKTTGPFAQFIAGEVEAGVKVRQGQRVRVSGVIQFEKKENGWSVDQVKLSKYVAENAPQSAKEKAVAAAWMRFDRVKPKTPQEEQVVNFTIRGVKLGDTLTEVMAIFPSLHPMPAKDGTPDPKGVIGDDVEKEGPWGLTSKQGLADADEVVFCLHAGRVYSMDIIYLVDDNKPDGWEVILNGLKGKFGEPNAPFPGFQQSQERMDYAWAPPDVLRCIQFIKMNGMVDVSAASLNLSIAGL